MNAIKNIRKITYVIVLYFFSVLWLSASHIKAGEFSAKRDPNNPLSYDITLTLYYTTIQPTVDLDVVTIFFGDGKSQAVTRQPKVDIGNNTTKNVFTVMHTYNGPATYLVRMSEQFRNANIENIPIPDGTSFYVEMQLQVSPFIGLDNTPVMTVPPVDFAAEGKIFTHNPGAYDIDGDSLSYELIPSQYDLNAPIQGYAYPDDPKFNAQSTLGGPAFIEIDASTGELVWNAPGPPFSGASPRFYNIAIKITEWRAGRAIGYVVRDMQIEVKDPENDPPKLTLPDNLCIEAGGLIQKPFSAMDPDTSDRVKLEYFGLPFTITPNPATAEPIANQNGKTPSGIFTWQTTCAHVREQPYDVVFKATDQNPASNFVPLVDIRSWQIYVKAPKIKNINTVLGTNSITLNWPLYSCHDKVEVINIYRRDCDSVAPNTDPCKTGPLAGYTLIGSVKGNVTTYLDNNKNKGLDKGKSYCYILVAKFKFPAYGESYPSDQVCAELDRDVPVFSTISVTQTSLTNGAVYLNWYKPSGTLVTVPYHYQLERGIGASPTTFEIVEADLIDTFYTDNNLNTQNRIYSYRILLKNNNLLTTSLPILDLTTVSGNAQVDLSWKYGTPWTTDSVEVYRKINTGTFSKIKTLYGTLSSYKDDAGSGVQNCDTIYYYVRQYGTYCDKDLKEIAIQTSAIDSVRPLNDQPPIAPVLTVQGCNGDLSVFKNLLNWTNLSDPICNNIDHYNVYFAPHNTEEPSLLLSLKDTTYIYNNTKTTAGCFVVSATNVAGVEGAKSEKICVDDCVYYELPNLITRNNDGKNDVFYPYNFPRGVAKVNFYVYNAWGDLVYFSDQDTNINWDGRSINGDVTDGVYYFLAEVTYYGRLKKEDEQRKIKGWIQVVTAAK